MTQHHLPIIILGAGASVRMRGRDKLLEIVDGAPLIARQAALARKVTDGPVIVTLPPRPHPRHATLAGLDVTPLEVRDAAEGMSASIRAAIAALPADAPAAMLLLADMPALTENDLRAVLRTVDLSSSTLVWRGMTKAGVPGHPIVFARALFADLIALRGDSGGRSVVAQAGPRTRLVALPDSDARLDLDTPEDWKRWRASQDGPARSAE